MQIDIKKYNESLSSDVKKICDLLAQEIDSVLTEAESKIWHGHPVWFLEGNPVVGYSLQKAGIKLLFWSGVGFNETKLQPGTGKFKDASFTYTALDEVNVDDLKRWLKKSRDIQWDYKNIVKRKGVLERRK